MSIHFLFFILIGTVFVIGLILIGEARRKRPDYPACRNCEYNLSGQPGTAGRCPECGIPLNPKTVRPPREPYTNKHLLLAGIIIVVLSIPGCCLGDAMVTIFFGPP